ncbi:MAG: HTTM domain-containing protein [Ignavibacteria bacterium]|nr:HTTM domain-containing protein [Ignavibacteria bacterium]MBK7184924.1 HTTM domain-containing protein [Ignavibacteria bacterium]MBK7576372.1 HTTM domain-containing protein [Ignavibacteria bacterium]MBK9182032.1 HTTM domain-containing protein [Ignavibacteria bacterium]MBL0321616.1 HTTM domain-containing protein [Ignavibacteria bacterium]
MTISCVRFIALGWVDEQYIRPTMHFPYLGFEWVTALGAQQMYILFGVMTAAAIGIMLGAWYRVSAVVFFLCFTYIELIDKTYYLNHYYFVSLVAFLFCWVPANRRFSLDVWRRPELRTDSIRQWTLDVFKFQIGLVYFYAGIAKITSSWLIDAMPLRIWLPAQSDLPVIGPLMTLWWLPWAFAWIGMIYDVSVPFLLSWKRTRLIAYLAVIVFHGVTGMMFQIGVFPLVMIAMTLVFFADSSVVEQGRTTSRRNSVVTFGLVVYFVVQILVPLRYLLYPGELLWTEEGYRFSWRVMLMEKAGTAAFVVEDRATGRRGYVDNSTFLNAHQEKQMSMQPDMIVQYAHKLHDHYEALGMKDPRVTAEVWVTLNGAPSALLIDPERDLSRVELGFHSYDWIRAR